MAGACFYSCSPTLTNAANGNITAAPAFVSLTNRDYRLLADSPCISAGVYEPWMDAALDLAGNARILGSAVEMGAYEYKSPRPKGSLLQIR